VFEYIPNTTKNSGREITVSFWESVHEIMKEEIKPHRTLVISGQQIAVEPHRLSLQARPPMGRPETQGWQLISADDGCVL